VTLASIAVNEALLVLKLVFLVVLYLFLWRIVRAGSRDLRLPQESFILTPQQASGLLGASHGVSTGRLVVVDGPGTATGDEWPLDSAVVTLGRGNDNTIPLDADSFASAHHARVEPRRDGIWLVDGGSTNGTFVNGVRISQPRKLKAGDTIRVGETDLRYERA
jgi:hypothetical protein